MSLRLHPRKSRPPFRQNSPPERSPRPADDREPTALFDSLEDLPHAESLHAHSRHSHDVGTGDCSKSNSSTLSSINVTRCSPGVRRPKGQTRRRHVGSLPEKRQRVLKSPIRRIEGGIDQHNICHDRRQLTAKDLFEQLQAPPVTVTFIGRRPWEKQGDERFRCNRNPQAIPSSQASWSSRGLVTRQSCAGSSRTASPVENPQFPRRSPFPFTFSEEFVNNSGLLREALVDVGSDHGLSDPEPLQVMLEACERLVGVKKVTKKCATFYAGS